MDCDLQPEEVDEGFGRPAVATPPEVLNGLLAAFGNDQIGEVGYEIAAAKCCSDEEKAAAQERGSSLLYGELLPDGVSKALTRGRLGAALTNSGGLVLELGMGSGKVALQIFLQCPTAQKVLGVEIVQSRYALAEAALQKLAQAHPERFRVSSHQPGELIAVEDTARRVIEFQCADFFTMGLDFCERSDVIIFAVNIPCKAFPDLCKRLSRAKQGARLFAYHSLESIWWLEQSCPFHHCEANKPETDMFATSWSPQGYRFYVYKCDRTKPSEIEANPRNESFSQWQVMVDATSGQSYFFNNETEVSQWETPMEAGGWRVAWSQEHSAHFFWHESTNHSQWEVPECLRVLGWGETTSNMDV